MDIRKRTLIALSFVIFIVTTSLVLFFNSPNFRFKRMLGKIKSNDWEVEEKNYGVFFLRMSMGLMKENPNATLTIMEVDNLKSFLDYAGKFLADKIYYDNWLRVFFCFTPISKRIVKFYW